MDGNTRTIGQARFPRTYPDREVLNPPKGALLGLTPAFWVPVLLIFYFVFFEKVLDRCLCYREMKLDDI